MGAFCLSQCRDLGLHSETTMMGLLASCWACEEEGLGCSSASSYRWTFLLEMGFVVLPSSLPYPGGCGKWCGWLGGRELGVWQRLCFGSAFGSPNPLKTSFPSLTSWAFGLISSHTQASGSPQDPRSQHLRGF